MPGVHRGCPRPAYEAADQLGAQPKRRQGRFDNSAADSGGGIYNSGDSLTVSFAAINGISGDWNADLVDTAGIFRGSNGTIYLSNTNASGGAPAPTDETIVWGTNGWIPRVGVTGIN